jgi:stearoyl-CoA 9-desaturase NADPH oxidoreductase
MRFALPVPSTHRRKLAHVPSALLRTLRERAVPRLDRQCASIALDVPVVEMLLRTIDPTLSLRAVRARVVSVRPETHDVTTFVLRPNARFRGFRAGSYVTLSLDIEGQRVERSYSISSAPSDDGSFAITVKRVPGGRVSNYLCERLRVGDVLELSAPTGQFVLPRELPAELLMISAGSGITPVMSMLRQLARERPSTRVTFLHFARTPHDIVFHEELLRIASEWPALRLGFCVEEAPERSTYARGRFREELLTEMAPNYRELDTFLCGPSGFMRSVVQTFESQGADLAKLRYERFSADFDATQFLEHTQVVRFVRSGTEVLSSRPQTILQQAESAGVVVDAGCRAGNCGTCRSLKRCGVVVDVTTGRESGSGEEFIYPCVSVPKGTVEVVL